MALAEAAISRWEEGRVERDYKQQISDTMRIAILASFVQSKDRLSRFTAELAQEIIDFARDRLLCRVQAMFTQVSAELFSLNQQLVGSSVLGS